MGSRLAAELRSTEGSCLGSRIRSTGADGVAGISVVIDSKLVVVVSRLVVVVSRLIELIVEDTTELEGLDPEQIPKADWQPASQ